MKYQNIIKRQTKVVLMIVICCVLVIIGASYALFMSFNSNKDNQVINAGDLNIAVTKMGAGGNDSTCLVPMDVLDYRDIEDSRVNCKTILKIENKGSLASEYTVYVKNDIANKGSDTYIDHNLIRLQLKQGTTSTVTEPESASVAYSYFTDGTIPEAMNTSRLLRSFPRHSLDNGQVTDDGYRYLIYTGQLQPGQTSYLSLDYFVDEQVLTNNVTGQTLRLITDVEALVLKN